MTSRRSFLAGLLAAAAAPAIVRSESLMKLWVPPQDIFVPPPSWDMGSGDWTVEFWHRPLRHKVHQHMAVVRDNGVERLYLDGYQVGRQAAVVGNVIRPVLDFWGSQDVAAPVYDRGYVVEFRATKGVARVLDRKGWGLE